MIQIIEKKKCCGCTACYSVCPKNAISMEPDAEGFLYPNIDSSKCIECKLCEKVCPVVNNQFIETYKKEAFAMRSTCKSNLSKSTSGGMFFPLLGYVTRNEGVMCVAGYNDNFSVAHQFIDTSVLVIEDDNMLDRFRGSKYVQSYLGNTFIRIKEYLDAQRLVCFIGTTCQVAGLKSFLRKDYGNLVLVDLVCHGTPSPKLWEEYLNYQEKKHKAKIRKISFRSKVFGYHSGGMMHIQFDDKSEYIASARVDMMLKSFFKEIASRPSCYDCKFKGLERCSDITLYDCWSFSQITNNQIDDDHGFTNVIINSVKGKTLLANMQNSILSYPVNMEKAVKLDGVMINKCPKPHNNRNNFYDDLCQLGIKCAIQKNIPITRKDYIIEFCKHVLYRMGLLNKLKSIIGRVK